MHGAERSMSSTGPGYKTHGHPFRVVVAWEHLSAAMIWNSGSETRKTDLALPMTIHLGTTSLTASQKAPTVSRALGEKNVNLEKNIFISSLGSGAFSQDQSIKSLLTILKARL